MKEISIEEFSKLNKDDYVLIDVRDEGLRHYGTIPGAIAIDIDEDSETVNKKIEELPKEKRLIFYCEVGRKTRDFEEDSFPEGYECYSLEGGYVGYVRSKVSDDKDIEEKKQKAEESIRKKFHKQLFTPFAKA